MRIKDRPVAILIMAAIILGAHPGFSLQTKSINFSQRIPAPSEMSVDQVVTGRVSSLRDIDIVNVGKKIPETYSSGKIFNTPGYDWYVSKHFALKTNFPADKARLYLELLEMSYPHYVELFGVEPPDIQNRRIAVVYSPTQFEAKMAMMDDGFQRGPGGGGETMYFNRAAYNFKSSREQHQRYIVIHETAHAFQMAVMDYTGWFPEWFVEGLADSVAHHIYDSRDKRLAVMNFDRGSAMDYIRLGLEEYEKLKQPTIEDITLRSDFYRGINFLIVHFLLDNPRRSHLLKIYRDEMARLRLPRIEARKKSVDVLKGVFGDWAAVEKDFAEFVKSIDKTFNVSGGPWEQDGNAYFVRLDNSDNGLPRLDFLLKPAQKPYSLPFKVDQFSLRPSPFVGPVARGVIEPSLGLKIDYEADHLHRGKSGMGLGLWITEASRKKMEEDKAKKGDEKKSYNPDEDELYEIVIEQGNTLVFDGRDFGAERLAYPLAEKFLHELDRQEKPELGMTVTLKTSEISVLLRTGDQGETQFRASVPVSADVRAKLMGRNLALIAEGASHRLTPYFDDGRDLAPYPADYTVPAPNNVFRNPADGETTRLAKAVWLLGERAPQAVRNELTALLKAADKSPAVQAAAYARLQNMRSTIVSQIASLPPALSEKSRSALLAFAGIHIRDEWGLAAIDQKRPVQIVLYNPSELPLVGEIFLTVLKDGAVIDRLERKDFHIPAGGSFSLPYTAPPYDDEHKIHLRTAAHIIWAQQRISWDVETAEPFPWSTMDIVKPARLEGGEIRIAALFRGPLDGETKGKMIMEVMPSSCVEKALLTEDVALNPRETKIFERSFKLKDGANPRSVAVNVRFELSVDDEPVKIEKRSMVEDWL